KRCLETLQGRSRRWLHEYYFLLGCYGVYAGKFGTYQPRDFLAAYLGAGFALGRYAWATSKVGNLMEAAAEQARGAIARSAPAAGRADPSPVSYHAAFAFAREFTRSKKRSFVEAALALLGPLRADYPYVLEFGQELALAYLELFHLAGDRGHL